jgi:hypothetical protein
MEERERFVVSGLVVLMLVLWLGFLAHRSPRFAGSLAGGMLGISGALLMLVPLGYAVVKRIGPARRFVTRRVSLRTLLAWHIYAGIVGPILALLHTGHKFQSPLGITLTAMMLVVVLSGFIGRYLLREISQEVREKRETLSKLQAEYDRLAGELERQPNSALAAMSGFWPRFRASFFTPVVLAAESGLDLETRAVRLAESIADVEYAVKTHETFKAAFNRWLKFHIALSATLYALLAFHVWSEVYYGLRWFE